MWNCPVCGNIERKPTLCSFCSFDGSTDREQYPTLMVVEDAQPSLQRRFRDRKAAESDAVSRCNELQEIIERLQDDQLRQQEALRSYQENTDARLDAICSRLSAVEERAEALAEQNAALDACMQKLRLRLEAEELHGQELEELMQSSASDSAQPDQGLLPRLSALEERTGALASEMQALNAARPAAAASGTEELELRVDQLDRRMNDVDACLSNLTDQNAQLDSRMQRLKTRLAAEELHGIELEENLKETANQLEKLDGKIEERTVPPKGNFDHIFSSQDDQSKETPKKLTGLTPAPSLL